jgi:hypothetical protein
MLAGIVVLYVGGREGCLRVPGLAVAIVPGGWFVALLQLFPLLHVFAGCLAAAVAVGLGFVTAQPVYLIRAGAAGAFVMTLVTGGILIGAAVLAGMILRLPRLLSDRYYARQSAKARVVSDDDLV